MTAGMMPFGNGNRPGMMRQMQERIGSANGIKADPTKLFTEKERGNKEALVAALGKRFLQSKLKPKQEQTLREFLASRGALDDNDIFGAIRLVMSTPEFQLT